MENLKDTLLGTLQNGKNVLSEIETLRKEKEDIIYVGNEADKITGKIHPKSLELKVVSITEQNHLAKTIRFESTSGYLPVFEAGQYVNLFTEIDGVRTSRPYSISSSPDERDHIEITVARIQTGFVSDYFLDQVKVGDIFEANGPAGVFTYNPIFHKKTSVFLAGGSGITPFLSMSRQILSRGEDREVHLIYGCRSAENAIFHKEFMEMNEKYENFKYHLVVSGEDESWTGERGFIDQAMISKLVPDVNACTYYICGPQIMNDFCEKELKAMGIPKKRIRREMFGASQNVTSEPGWPKALTGEEVFHITIGDKKYPAITSESILTSLERAGVRVNVCCRSGECSLCRVKLVSGNVFLSKGMLLRLADEKYGYIHSCKSFPIGDIEIQL